MVSRLENPEELLEFGLRIILVRRHGLYDLVLPGCITLQKRLLKTFRWLVLYGVQAQNPLLLYLWLTVRTP